MPQYNLYMSAQLWTAIEKHGKVNGSIMRDSIKNLLRVGLQYFDAKFDEDKRAPRPKALLATCQSILAAMVNGKTYTLEFLMRACGMADSQQHLDLVQKAILQLKNEGLIYSPKFGCYALAE